MSVPTENSGVQCEHKNDTGYKARNSVSGREAMIIVVSVFITVEAVLIAVLFRQITSSFRATEIKSEVSVQNLRESLEGPFGLNRHHTANPAGKAAARTHIIHTFEQHGLEVTVQNFTGPGGNIAEGGANIIGAKRGKLSGTSDDKIVAVGAHYDTVSTSPGVDDDGSGMAAMLEVVRMMTSCEEQNYTAIFVAFDKEEVKIDPSIALGTPCETARGSDDFVCSWLLPFLQSSGGPEFQGIFMLETIMNYDPRPNVQQFLQGAELIWPDVHRNLVDSNFAGNFLLLIHKPEEEHAVTVFKQTWEERSKNPAGASILNMNVPIPGKPSEALITQYYDFLGRSDCLSFWVRDPYFRCVFVSDTANYRGSMQQCYHQPCDNVTSITDDKLTFLAKVTDSVLQTTMKLAEVNLDSCSKGVTSAGVGLGGSFITLMTSLATACILFIC